MGGACIGGGCGGRKRGGAGRAESRTIPAGTYVMDKNLKYGERTAKTKKGHIPSLNKGQKGVSQISLVNKIRWETEFCDILSNRM